MKIVAVEPLALPGPLLLRFARFGDARGYFTETFRAADIAALTEQAETPLCGLDRFVIGQINESRSKAGVVRGLHFQWDPPMGKLVRTLAGRMLDLVMDIRVGSIHFGKAIAIDMPAPAITASEDRWVWVPPGFAHGNVYLEDSAIEYLCSGHWNPQAEAGVCPLADDIDWSLCDPASRALVQTCFDASPELSTKDRDAPTLTQWREDARAKHFVFDG